MSPKSAESSCALQEQWRAQRQGGQGQQGAVRLGLSQTCLRTRAAHTVPSAHFPCCTYCDGCVKIIVANVISNVEIFLIIIIFK